MIDERFYTSNKVLSVAEIAVLVGGKVERGAGDLVVSGVAIADKVDAGELCFVESEAVAGVVGDREGVVCLATADLAEHLGGRLTVITTSEPKSAFGVVLRRMFASKSFEAGVDERAAVADDAVIGEGCLIESHVFIDSGVEIGSHCHIKSGARIESGCIIGEGCVIGGNASLSHTIMGAWCETESNVVLGSAGFGIGKGDAGHFVLPHLGRVLIGEHCHIGAGSCIDRGFIDDTVIGDYVMIDNLVHIGHNCRIGNGNIICGCVGFAGSAVVGDNNVFAGQVGVADHITIGSNNVFAGQAGVSKSVGDDGVWGGNPAIPIAEHRKQKVSLRRLASRDK